MTDNQDQNLVVAYLGLGSNQGNMVYNVRQAVESLGTLLNSEIVAFSRMYRSEPWGFTEQEWFVNMVVALATSLKPHELLAAVKEIEKRLGRKPSSLKWGARIIDIDILLYGQEIIDTPELKVPHPYLTERLFYLKPLLEIAPLSTLPTSGKQLQDYAENLEGKQQVVPLE